MGNTSNEMLNKHYITPHYSNAERERLHDSIFSDYYKKCKNN